MNYSCTYYLLTSENDQPLLVNINFKYQQNGTTSCCLFFNFNCFPSTTR